MFLIATNLTLSRQTLLATERWMKLWWASSTGYPLNDSRMTKTQTRTHPPMAKTMRLTNMSTGTGWVSRLDSDANAHTVFDQTDNEGENEGDLETEEMEQEGDPDADGVEDVWEARKVSCVFRFPDPGSGRLGGRS